MEIDYDWVSILVRGLEVRRRNVEDQFERAASPGESRWNDDLEIGTRGFRICEMVEFHPDGHQGPPYGSLHEQSPASKVNDHVLGKEEEVDKVS